MELFEIVVVLFQFRFVECAFTYIVCSEFLTGRSSRCVWPEKRLYRFLFS